MRLHAAALDARPFTAAQLAALYAAIQVNDRIAAAGPLPALATLDYDQPALIDGFGLSRQLWRAGYDRAALRDLIETLRRGSAFGADEQRRFKDIRAKFKHLRFAFVLYSARHRCPAVLQALTTTLGHLQDAFKRGDGAATRQQAGLARLLLADLPQARLGREVDRLEATTAVGFRRYVSAEMASLGAMLARPSLSGAQFHATRKIVSRQVSFHDDMGVLFPNRDHAALSRYLAAINGLMGAAHDDVVLRRASGDATHLTLSPDLRTRLTAVVALYLLPVG